MTKAEKQMFLLKLMVLAINEIIRRGAIDLNGKSIDSPDGDKGGHVDTAIGGKRTIINWFDSGYDELRISVWWDYQPELSTVKGYMSSEDFRGVTPLILRRHFYKFLGACGSCYFERRTGKFIVGGVGRQFFNVYVREYSYTELSALPIEQPLGYETTGIICESSDGRAYHGF